MQTTAIGTVANSLPENEVILLTLLISKGYILFAELRNKFDCKYIANKFYRLNGISCGFLRFVPVKCDMWRLCLAGRYLDLCIVKMTPCPALLSSMGRGGAHGCNPISCSLYAADSIFAARQIYSSLGKYIRIVALFVIIYKIYSV